MAFLLAHALAASSTAATVDTATVVSLKAGLSLTNIAELDRVFTAVSTPDDAQYLQFISDPASLGDLFGASQDQVDATVSWLVDDLGCAKDAVQVSATRDTVTCTELVVDDELRARAAWDEDADEVAEAARPSGVEFVLQKRLGQASPLVAEDQRTAKAHKSKRELLRELYGEPEVPDSFYSITNIKKAYGIPDKQKASNNTTQMVWGPGTFGYSESELEFFKLENCPEMNTKKVKFDTKNHGTSGGDNFGEGQLDTQMTAAFGLNVLTLVSNTNTSSSTEEGNGFGEALLDFLTELYARDTVPHVLSMSLGSLSAASCDLLCTEAVKAGHTLQECNEYLQKQRQVCMFLSQSQSARINHALQLLGVRGITVLGASGDGGSHFSFGPFQGGSIASTLNKISCEFQFPVYPTASPYVLSVGGEEWTNGDMNKPKAWSGSGGGFSWQFGALSHQQATVDNYLKTTHGLPASTSFNATGRAYPDVAAVSIDGTSQSCPTVAGILSLVIDYRLNQGLPPLGFVAPRLYEVSTKFPGEAFQDIPTGNTKTSCSNGFPATTSWDPVTGWGRPQWQGLLKHFGSDNATWF